MGKSEHNHVTPAGYLQTWATDERIAMRLVGETESRLVSVSNAGVRKGFYLEHDADGTTSDRFEKRLALVEGKLLPVVIGIDDFWPFSPNQRGAVAEYIALQFVRSPAWKAFHGNAVGAARRNLPPRWDSVPAAVLSAVEDDLRTDKQRHRALARQQLLIGTMVANMHWTLLICGQPRLATCDHPVVPLVVADSSVSAVPPRGLMNTSEIRFAMSPRHLLVATWRDEVDGQPQRKATIDHVRKHNGLVIAQAEKQWFHHPNHTISHSAEPWEPIAHSLFSNYDPVRSSRRTYVEQIVVGLIEQGDKAGRQIILAEWGTSPDVAA